MILGTGEPSAYSYLLCDRTGVIQSLGLPPDQVIFGAYVEAERLSLLTVDGFGVMRVWVQGSCVRTINPWFDAGGRLLVAPILVAPGVVACREAPDVVLLCTYPESPAGECALHRWTLSDVKQLASNGDGTLVVCCGERLVAAGLGRPGPRAEGRGSFQSESP